ncbi:hypothetical protein [Cysteiniphilum marinum]|uniref:hypothetical protein n=1 Tax=Cysteiniphilum marinum TaxID=2774191 RepID=UPI0019398BEE|nr:hypothetical protein [Cysteiniphilum marinum]
MGRKKTLESLQNELSTLENNKRIADIKLKEKREEIKAFKASQFNESISKISDDQAEKLIKLINDNPDKLKELLDIAN